MPKVLLSVINDLHSDQRVHRTCTVWQEMGYEVVLSGRTYPNPELLHRPYRTTRFCCWFHHGPLFYLEFQWRLWGVLRRENPDVYLANDLDTLWPNAFWAKRRGKPLVYDSHEYFLGAPELESRPLIQRAWRWIEKRYLPEITAGVTVNATIAQAYYREYGQSFQVARNMPLLPEGGLPFPPEGDGHQEMRRRAACAELQLPPDRPIWLLQGAGINIDRGAEELLEAVGQHPKALLLIVGSGDALPGLQKRAKIQGWNESKVRFVGRKPREKLRQYTQAAHLGFSLDKPKSQNYRWSLPNKLFDYFQAGVPVIVSDLVEVVAHLGTAGAVLPETTPEAILRTAEDLMQPRPYAMASQSAMRAAHRYHWEVEKATWEAVIRRIQGEKTIHVWSMDRMEPPPYGGTLEVSGQVERFVQAGYQVVVHATTKGDLSHTQALCLLDYPEVHFRTYRRSHWALASWRIPYTVGSRDSPALRRAVRTARGQHVVQGTHLTGLPFPSSAILRWHNPEAAYYRSLSQLSRGFMRAFLWMEAIKLQRWENQLARRWKGPVWVLTSSDATYWKNLGGAVPVVVPPQKIFPGTTSSTPAVEMRLLVPGKFSVPENERAALWTLEVPVPVCWAGHGFSRDLRRLAEARGVQILEQPHEETMAQAFHSAAMVLVHAEHTLGLKLKLIQAFTQSRWVIAHDAAVMGLGLPEEASVLTYRDVPSLQEAVRHAVHLGWDAPRAAKAIEARKPWTTPPSVADFLA